MNRFATTLFLFSLAGCALDGTEVDGTEVDGTESPEVAGEATASTAQAVSWTSTTWHTCSGSECSGNLGSTADRTCFLAGITGALAGGSSLNPVGANVSGATENWRVFIRNPNNNKISVMTTCIANTANRVTAHWYTGNAATLIPAGPSSTRRCFLGGVWSLNSTGFSTFASNVQVWRDGNDHFLGGSMPAGSSNSVFATCVDVPTSAGTWAYGNGTASTVTGNISYNPAAGGVACGLTSIGGKLTTASTSNGVVINYNSATRFWNWTFSPWTGADALCVN
ncbi:hypothetical protein WME94_55940 [Sorangium sp. So ce429]